MLKRGVLWTFVVPIVVIAFVVAGIVGIGSLLLATRAAAEPSLGHNALYVPVAVALALVLITSLVATVLAVGGPREPSGHGPDH